MNFAGSIRLFRVLGINVYLHWTWLIFGVIRYYLVRGTYEVPYWAALEFVGLFGIVLLHEFGHSLACRSVGGRAEHIMLWPLGGVAFVQPPDRPGAVLWSIVAGPLVNVLLAPVLIGIALAAGVEFRAFLQQSNDLQRFLWVMSFLNILILAFNLLPVYPLDGGQILQSLLWFILGRSTSLMIVAVIGLVVAIAGGLLAVWARQTWLVIIAAFIGLQAWQGMRIARVMALEDRAGVLR